MYNIEYIANGKNDLHHYQLGLLSRELCNENDNPKRWKIVIKNLVFMKDKMIENILLEIKGG